MCETNTTSGFTESYHSMVPVLSGAVVVVVDQLSKLAASSADCGRLICPLRNEALFLGLAGGSSVNALATGLGGLALFVGWVCIVRRLVELPPIAVALVVAGIVANTMDRVAFGSVRDFLTIPGGVVINVADVADVGGLLVCVATVTHTLLRSPSIPERG